VRGWRVARVSNDREIALVDWRILKTGRGVPHVVGICVETGKSHTSSGIRRLDLRTMSGVTGAGCTYRLVGLPAPDDTILQIWSKLCVAVGEPPPLDITADMLALRSYQSKRSGSLRIVRAQESGG
jgi:hypothetical protein